MEHEDDDDEDEEDPEAAVVAGTNNAEASDESEGAARPAVDPFCVDHFHGIDSFVVPSHSIVITGQSNRVPSGVKLWRTLR